MERLANPHKRLAVTHEDDRFAVVELDRDGHVVGQWGEGETRDEAVAAATEVLDTLFGKMTGEPEVDDALLATARLLPSDALRAVLQERGDL